MIARWEKRNGKAMENYNPANLNKKCGFDLHRRYGDAIVQDKLDELHKTLGSLAGTKEDPRL